MNQAKYNGFELWRKLFCEHEGCDLMVQMAGQRKFLDFAPVQNVSELWTALESWLDLRYKYAYDMPEQTVKIMRTHLA